MQDDPEARAIAATLTKAQKRIVRRAKGPWGAFYSTSPGNGTACWRLVELGVAAEQLAAGSPYWSPYCLTPIGFRVRAVLEQEAAVERAAKGEQE